MAEGNNKQVNKQLYDIIHIVISSRKKNTVRMRERAMGEVVWQRAVKEGLAKKETLQQSQHGVKEQVSQASGERVSQENRSGNAKA